MNKKRLLKKLQKIFDAEARKKHLRSCEIKKILKRLKDKERKLAAKLDNTDDPEKRTLLRQKLDIIYAQRRKGIKILQELETQ
ncbi:MAG: hypothetical protein ACU837_16765 [Gammaproteobacteria bacterium]